MTFPKYILLFLSIGFAIGLLAGSIHTAYEARHFVNECTELVKDCDGELRRLNRLCSQVNIPITNWTWAGA